MPGSFATEQTATVGENIICFRRDAGTRDGYASTKPARSGGIQTKRDAGENGCVKGSKQKASEGVGGAAAAVWRKSKKKAESENDDIRPNDEGVLNLKWETVQTVEAVEVSPSLGQTP